MMGHQGEGLWGGSVLMASTCMFPGAPVSEKGATCVCLSIMSDLFVKHTQITHGEHTRLASDVP